MRRAGGGPLARGVSFTTPSPSLIPPWQVEVLSREALQQAESDLAIELELQAANGIDSDGRDFSAADLEGIVARRDLIKHRRDTFGPARDAAQEGLRAAASSGDAVVMEARDMGRYGGDGGDRGR